MQSHTSKKIFGLSQKLFCIFTSVLLISLMSGSIVMYRNSYRLASESLDKSTRILIQNYTHTIDDFFQRTNTISEWMTAEIPSLITELENDTSDFYFHYHSYKQLHQNFNSLIKSAIGEDIHYRAYLCLHDNFFMASFLSSPKDNFLSKSVKNYDLSSFSVINEKNLMDDSWFLDTLDSVGSPFWFMNQDNPDTIWIASSLEGNFLINNAVQHYSIGIFLIGIDISWITSQLDNSAFDSVPLFFITDSQNRIIYARDTSLMNQDITSMYTSDGMHNDSTVTMQGISYHIWENTPANNIHLLFFMPEYTLKHQVYAELKVIIWMLLLSIAIGVLLSAFFSQFITRPIRKLSAHMEMQSSLSPITPYYSRDEIGTLYRCFNDMAEREQALIQQIYNYAEEQRQLKYQMLQAQINPHFLYNTLDSVGCMALMHGENELNDVLSNLASLLRYNINQPDQLVTLSEELKIVDKYVSIQQFRYDNNICYTSEINPKAADAKLPKSIIQPLIENSIMYCGAQPDGYRYLSLSAYINMSGDSVSIILKNDISPNNPATVSAERLNSYLNGDCQLQRNSSGLGIRNVHQRIQIVFGEDYGLHYEQQESQLATVLLIPLFE
ncbi:MAG: histidine kinase [Roseburia sp.]|nr:histidine kinase [Roseburia sp.]